MTNLEYIEKEIDYCWSKYEFHKNEPTSDFNNAAMELYSEKIEYLNRVKTIIEAWEVVFDNTMGDDYRYEINIWKCDKDYEKFDKAFEMYNKKY